MITLKQTCLAVLLAASSLNSHAQFVDLGLKAVGIAKKFDSLTGWFAGSMTVTPAYTFYSWSAYDFGQYSNYSWYTYQSVTKDMVTGVLFWSSVQSYRMGDYQAPWTSSSSSFPLNGGLERQNYSCSPGPGYSFNHIQDFRLAVWAQSMVPSGAAPPQPPYDAVVKMWATPISNDCNPPTATGGPVREACSIGIGYAVVVMEYLPAQYAYPPMAVWCGGLWDQG